MAQSDWVVFVDESGDHSLASIDEKYPIFALTFCLIHKDEYIDRLRSSAKKASSQRWGRRSVIS